MNLAEYLAEISKPEESRLSNHITPHTYYFVKGHM